MSVQEETTPKLFHLSDHMLNVGLIRPLDKEAKGLWDTAFTKIFDIGYEGGLEPRSYTSEIRADTVEQVAALGASLRVTIYPPVQDDFSS